MKLTLLSTLLLLTQFGFGQYKKIYFKSSVSEGDVKFEISDAVATATELKFKLRVINNTDAPIVYKPEESAVVINGVKNIPSEKRMVIRAHDDNAKTINIPGSFLDIRSFDFVSGGFYKGDLKDLEYQVADVRIPPASNVQELADFRIELEKFDKSTSGTAVKFKITYLGKQIGALQPKQATLKMPDEKYYAVTGGDSKPELLFPGESTGLTLKWSEIAPGRAMDMQFVEMFVNLQKVLRTGVLNNLPVQTLNVVFDAALTDAKK